MKFQISLFSCLLLLSACSSDSPISTDPPLLPHDAYIWQRSWTSNTLYSLTESRSFLFSVVPLSHQINFGTSGKPKAIKIKIDWTALADSSHQVGIAIRIGSSPTPLNKDSETLSYVEKAIAESMNEAKAVGIKLTEIQIDFDSASNSLSEYADWLSQIRPFIDDTPLTITVLPDWLHQEDFPLLLDQVDEYVLQVHWLQHPKNSSDPLEICSPAKSLHWAKAADQFGRPFRIALPTYGYALSFDEAGNFIELSAEDSVQHRQHVVEIRTDPHQMQQLANDLRHIGLLSLTGIIWYRLPVISDQRNWTLQTLRAVIQHNPLQTNLEIHFKQTEAKLTDMALTNSGNLPVALPEQLIIRYPAESHRLLAHDILPPYRISSNEDGKMHLELISHFLEKNLHPNQSCLIGWLRFDTIGVSLESDLPIKRN